MGIPKSLTAETWSEARWEIVGENVTFIGLLYDVGIRTRRFGVIQTNESLWLHMLNTVCAGHTYAYKLCTNIFQTLIFLVLLLMGNYKILENWHGLSNASLFLCPERFAVGLKYDYLITSIWQMNYRHSNIRINNNFMNSSSDLCARCVITLLCVLRSIISNYNAGTHTKVSLLRLAGNFFY
jgi:hypothetical protein